MTRNEGGLSSVTAGVIVAATVVGGVAIGGRSSPTPDHPRTRRWYKDLDKPSYNPPAPVYAMAWTGIQAGLAYGGYRLLRRPASSQRTLALTLWGINQAAIAGWSEIFFGTARPAPARLRRVR